MDQATDHLPGIITIHNDICVFGHTPEEHDHHLLCLMETTTEHGIIFNSASVKSGSLRLPSMMQCSLPSACGQTPPKSKPSQAKLQSFLGLINYLQPFIPSLSAKTTFLHDWNPSTDAAFQCLKAWICQTLLSATLAYYDWSKPVVVQMDTSEYRLGVSLIQSSCPIAFTSKTLTDIDLLHKY